MEWSSVVYNYTTLSHGYRRTASVWFLNAPLGYEHTESWKDHIFFWVIQRSKITHVCFCFVSRNYSMEFMVPNHYITRDVGMINRCKTCQTTWQTHNKHRCCESEVKRRIREVNDWVESNSDLISECTFMKVHHNFYMFYLNHCLGLVLKRRRCRNWIPVRPQSRMYLIARRPLNRESLSCAVELEIV